MPHPDIQKSPSASAPNVLKTADVSARRRVEGIELYYNPLGD